jgi:Ni/Co efflux regulator RcnB
MHGSVSAMPGEMSMKKLLVLAALATIVAAPAFAQAPASQQQDQLSYERNNNANPDRQLGGERWKTNTNKAKHAKHHTSTSQK